MATLNSPLAKINNSSVGTSSGQLDVITGSGPGLVLAVGCTVDNSLFGKGFQIDMDFQITNVINPGPTPASYWWSIYAHPASTNLDQFQNQGGSFWMSIAFATPSDAGVLGGGLGAAKAYGYGLYLFRPFLIITNAKIVQQTIPQGNADAQYAVGEDHFFYCD